MYSTILKYSSFAQILDEKGTSVTYDIKGLDVFSCIFLSVLKNGYIKCPYLRDFLYEKKKQIYSQNGHKLNHMFQKLLFHMFKSYFSASSTMFSDSNYRILNQSVSSIAIEVVRPMPSEQPPFNTGGVRQFFSSVHLSIIRPLLQTLWVGRKF